MDNTFDLGVLINNGETYIYLVVHLSLMVRLLTLVNLQDLDGVTVGTVTASKVL